MPPNKDGKEDPKIDVYGNPFKTIAKVTEKIHSSTNISNDNNAIESKSQLNQPKSLSRESDEDKVQTPLYLAIFGYISYTFLFCVSWIRELIYGLGPHRGRNKHRFIEKHREGYAPLYASFESFYVRNVYRRLADVFGNTIASVPGATVKVVERISDDDNWTFNIKEGGVKECINLASYNYLGFAENKGHCTEQAISVLKENGVTCCGS